MLHAYRGRINRKTFVLGILIGLAALGFAALIYIVPLALIEIVAFGSEGSVIIRVLYGLFVIPIIFFLFYASVLFVRRLHDIGFPGMIILWSIVLLMGLGRVLDIWLLNLLAVLIVGLVTLAPGQKDRNRFGAKAPRKFSLKQLAIHL